MAQVSQVDKVCIAIDEDRTLRVSASGMVPTSGWSGGRLEARIYVSAPEDGLQEFDFRADPPQGIVLPAFHPISADIVGQKLDWMVGVRVYASTNNIVALFSDSSCVISSKDIADYYPWPWRKA